MDVVFIPLASENQNYSSRRVKSEGNFILFEKGEGIDCYKKRIEIYY